MSAPTIVIADDHPLVRDALARAVCQLDAQTQVLEAQDFEGLCVLTQGRGADLALVDLNMPGMQGLDGLQRLREQAPTLPVVVISGQDDAATIRAVLATGAVGFLPKRETTEVLLSALRLVLCGGVYVPPCLLSSEAPPPAAELTPRQADVLRALMKGLPNKSIARELGLTEGTVKIHIASILRVLGARNRTEAVLRAREQGWPRPAR